MTTYSDILRTEEALEQLYQEREATDPRCVSELQLIDADIAQGEARMMVQCKECGVRYRTREDVIAEWNSLPRTTQHEGMSAHG